MDQTYTHISVVLDRTGSMGSIRDDTIGGFNTFLKDQQTQPGKATLTLVQFDSVDPYEVIHRFQPIQSVPELTPATYVPRGATPLLDALGTAINDLAGHLGQLTVADRPARIMVVVITDGRENASREFNKSQVEQLIKKKTEQEDWQFVFLSADLAAMDDATSVGFTQESMLLFDKSSQGASNAWASLSKQTSQYRSARKSKMGFDTSDRQPPDQPQ